MARKLKFRPPVNQPGLFDIGPAPSERPAVEEKLPIADPLNELAEDIHPSITDFVVKSATAPSANDSAAGKTATGVPMEVDVRSLRRPDVISYISFGSGSSGNCAYVGDANGGLLIDAGVDPQMVSDTLKRNGLSLNDVRGICLTHDHSDHVRYAYAIVRKHPHMAIYCTPKTMSGLLRRHSISRRIKDYHKPIYKEFPFNIGAFELTAFEVSHDGTDNAGYFITHGRHRFAVATDLGCITPRVDYYMRQAQYIMIESNYDPQMLRTGPYPMHLKARIAAQNGHLSNQDAAQFIAGIYSSQLSHVFLCHLSKDNNMPQLARSEMANALLQAGVNDIGDGSGSLHAQGCDVQVVVLPRYEASLWFTLGA